LRWVCAGDLKVGDDLIGFDEHPVEIGSAGNRQRRIRPSKVTFTSSPKRKIIRLEMSDGSTVRSSCEHPWLVATKASRNQKWLTAEEISNDLSLGRKRYMHKFFDPWKEINSRDAGWLSGVYDGEGSLSAKKSQGIHISISQKEGLVLNEIKKQLNNFNYKFGVYHNTKSSGVMCVQIQGGIFELMRILGSIRPIRLLDKFESRLLSGDMNKQLQNNSKLRPLVEIIKAYDEGYEYVAGLETSTKTYFCEGYGSHNSVAQHSIYVSHIVRLLGGSDQDVMWGLLHDASEAYLVDLPTPIKRQVIGYNDAEQEVMNVISSYFGLPNKMPEIVKKADEIMLATEARDLMGSPTDWNIKEKPADIKIIEMIPRQTMKDFIHRFATISFDISPNRDGTIDSFYRSLIGPLV